MQFWRRRFSKVCIKFSMFKLSFNTWEAQSRNIMNICTKYGFDIFIISGSYGGHRRHMTLFWVTFLLTIRGQKPAIFEAVPTSCVLLIVWQGNKSRLMIVWCWIVIWTERYMDILPCEYWQSEKLPCFICRVTEENYLFMEIQGLHRRDIVHTAVPVSS